jgi:ribosome-associated toxin RatA of RatAB toxin-antitoxin module
MAAVKKSIRIEAPRRKVFDVLRDYEKYPGRMPGIKEVEILEDDGTTAIVEFRIHIVKKFTYTLKLVHNPPESITWTYVGGDFKDINGSWVLEEDGDNATIANYSVDVEGGFLIPKAISNKLNSINIPQLLEAVKWLSEKED